MDLQINFGTDGIRGNATEYPFTPKALKILGKSIALWSRKKYGNKSPKCLIAHDTRISCPKIKTNLISGLLEENIEIIDGKILPTPAVLQIISKEASFDFGIVISASHNPFYDNGIKIFDAKSGKLNSSDEQIIIKNYSSLITTVFEKEEDFSIINSQINCQIQRDEDNFLGPNKEQHHIDNLEEAYISNILGYFQENFLNNKKIVLDCSNGATFRVAPKIFEALGAQVISIAASPNGTNINQNCGSLNIKNLQEHVLKTNSDCGFAFDGDGDRVIAVTSSGEIKDGDDFLTILNSHSKYSNTSKIVGTIMSNHGLESHLKSEGKHLLRTKVGDKYIRNMLEKEILLLGGEPSGHIIMMDYINSGDGIFVALRILETIILNNNWSFKTFTKCPQVLLNIPIEHKAPLTEKYLADIIKAEEKKLINGRLVIRYSGTENVLRIMAEDIDELNAKRIANSLAISLKEALATHFK